MKIFGMGLLLATTSCATSTPSADAGAGEGGAHGGEGGSLGGGGVAADGGWSSSGGGSATEVCEWSVCGGDPVGHWVYSTACAPNPVPGTCAGSSTTYHLYLTGTLDLEANGTLHVDTTSVQDTIIYYPKSCWPPFATKCEDFVQAEGLDLSCVDTAEDCTCTVTSTMVNGPSDDTYLVEGDQLLLGDGTALGFCADADHLLLVHDTGERTYLERAPD